MKIILILFTSILVFANSNYTPKIILGTSGNQHLASFDNLPGQPGTQGEFNPKFTLGFEFGLGLNYKFKKKLFGIFDAYSPELIYKNYSSAFTKEVLAGNLIKENEFNQAYYQFDLNTNLSYLLISNYLSRNYKKIDLFIGTDVGFIIGAKFNQIENLVAAPGYTFDDGSTSLNAADGDIQNINSLYIGANLGLTYNAYSSKSFDVLPYLSVRMGFTSVLQDVNWNPNSVNLGLKIHYKKQEKKTDLPKQPKLIDSLPPPKEPEILNWEISPKFTFNNKEINDNDSIIIPIKKISYIDKYKLPSIIYYEPGGVIPIESDLDKTLSKQLDLLDGIVKSAGSRDIVINYFSSDESIIDKRAKFLEEELLKRGFDKDQLKRVDSVISYKRKYKELDEENEKVEFIIEGNELVSVDYKKIDRIRNENEVNLALDYNSNYKVKSTNFKVSTKTKENKELPIKIQLNAQEVLKKLNDQIIISAKFSTEDRDTSFTKKISLIPDYQLDTLLNQTDDSAKKVSQFILAYFDFDSSEFNSIDYEVLEIIKKALNNNKQVQIYPLTDNLGANDYNKNLARKRGVSAIKLINNANVDVIYLDKAYFENNHPFGRTLNRSVLVRIEN